MADEPVTRCRGCALCAVWMPAGFLASEHMVCTRTGDDVSPGDGCTFGDPGSLQRGAVACDVELNHEMQTAYYYGD